MIGKCVQIGLHKTAEGLFLTEPNWRDLIPEGIDPTGAMSWDFIRTVNVKGWEYYGIDTDPKSISDLTARYGFSEKHKFIQAHVANSRSIVKSWHSLDYEKRTKQPHYTISDDISSILKLFSPITLLIVDIDCAEWELFGNYIWNVKPRYIVCEVNLFDPVSYAYIYKVEDFIKIFEAQGYTEFFRVPLQHEKDGETVTHAWTLQFQKQ